MKTCLILFFFFSFEIKFSRIYTISSSPSISPVFDVRFLQTCFLFTYAPIYLCFKLNQAVRSWITLGEISILRFVVKLEIEKNIVFFFFLMKTYVYICVCTCMRVFIFQGTILNCFNAVLVNELIKNSWILEFDVMLITI